MKLYIVQLRQDDEYGKNFILDVLTEKEYQEELNAPQVPGMDVILIKEIELSQEEIDKLDLDNWPHFNEAVLATTEDIMRITQEKINRVNELNKKEDLDNEYSARASGNH